MCRNLIYYPLVKLKNEENKKIIFTEPVAISNKDEFEFFNEMNKAFKQGRHSKYEYIQRLFQKHDIDSFEKFVQIPCGHCDECLKDRARQWCIRILKEAEQYHYNYFITLTYDDDKLPGYNLVKDEISKFNKKLKVALTRAGKPSDFRFYGVGEYGSKTARPHYHVIYFNLKLDDLVFYKTTDEGNILFNSPFIDSVWKKGFCVIGTVDVGSASYVARYVDKKRILTKEQKEELYSKGIVPEFSVMSRVPGIGSCYLEKVKDNFKNGIYTIPFRNNNFSIPKYFKDKIKEDASLDDLIDYENYVKLHVNCKVHQDLLLSYNVGDVNKYYEILSKNILNSRKERN